MKIVRIFLLGFIVVNSARAGIVSSVFKALGVAEDIQPLEKGAVILHRGEEAADASKTVHALDAASVSRALTQVMSTLPATTLNEIAKTAGASAEANKAATADYIADAFRRGVRQGAFIEEDVLHILKTGKTDGMIGQLNDRLLASMLIKASRAGSAAEREEIAAAAANQIHDTWRAKNMQDLGKDFQKFKPINKFSYASEAEAQAKMKQLEKEGFDKMRVEKNEKDGKFYVAQDINQAATKIQPDLNMQLNGELAKQYTDVALKKLSEGKLNTAEDFKNLLADVHEKWKKQNDTPWGRTPANEHLFGSYDSLTASSKLDDFRAIKPVLEQIDPKILENPHLRQYLASLADEAGSYVPGMTNPKAGQTLSIAKDGKVTHLKIEQVRSANAAPGESDRLVTFTDPERPGVTTTGRIITASRDANGRTIQRIEIPSTGGPLTYDIVDPFAS